MGDIEELSLQVSPPKVNIEGPLQMLVTNLDYDEHKGRIAIGRVTSGKISRAETVLIGRPGESSRTFPAQLIKFLDTLFHTKLGV
jgi:GTP-binding protein